MKPQHKATLALPFVLATLLTFLYLCFNYTTIASVIYLIIVTVVIVSLIWYWLFLVFGGGR